MDEDGVGGRKQEPGKQEPGKQEPGGPNASEAGGRVSDWLRLRSSDSLASAEFRDILKRQNDGLASLSSFSTSGLADAAAHIWPSRGEAVNERDNAPEPVRHLEEEMARYDVRTGNLESNVRDVGDKLADLKDQVESVSASSSTLAKDVFESQRLLRTYRHTMEKAEESLAAAERRSVELVGLVSSIIALILVSATSALSQRHPITVFLVVLLLAACLMLFACMLHVFFQPEAKRDRITYWTPFFVVPVAMIIIVGIVLFVLTITGWLGVVP
jgi:membrane-associated HD superfamily phosphohydrolase